MIHQRINHEVRRLRHPIRRLALCALIAVCVQCLGCGGNSFSGGSIPIGRAILTGKVILSLNPNSSVPNSTITVVSNYGNQQQKTFTTHSAADGSFVFGSIPTDNTSATVTFSVQPADPSLLAQQVKFVVPKGTSQTFIASLAPVSYPIQNVASIQVQAPATQISTGVPVQLTTYVFDANGNLLPLTPSYLFEGNFGTLTGTGTFIANNIGTGTIIALWYDNLQSNTVTVQSKSAAPAGSLPPPPPMPSGTPTQSTSK